MQTGLAGKVVIVTAATANIGRGIALAFAAEGARVVIVGRDAVAGELVAKLAREQGAADALWCQADLTVPDQVAAMVADARAAFGPVDVLVNNVGGNVAVAPFAESTPEQWQADLEINLVTTFRCTHLVVPDMLARGSGRIINIGSTAGLIGDRYLAVYSAAKGGVHAFTRVLALELGASGITVNAIAPYGTRSDDPMSDMSSGSRIHPETGVFARARAEDPERLMAIGRTTALPRQHARPPEIGAAAVYLASDQAAFVTGQTLRVDGGVMLV
ncbi:MAG TPA: SDR family NAD(P)-dependent oxidoreductase [Streptosporangiaceae bacterium]|nr:SDR family NAD(P)-dependent oxidoreductase [Streptosporangiaceae bacterium]